MTKAGEFADKLDLTGTTLAMRGPAAVARNFGAKTADLLRWTWGAGGDPETAVDGEGSSFHISRYNNAGAFVESVLQIDRKTGGARTYHGLTDYSGVLVSTGPQGAVPAPGIFLSRNINNALYFRWGLGLRGDDPGGNAGSDLGLARFDDNGAYLDDVMYVYRQTGVVKFPRRPVVDADGTAPLALGVGGFHARGITVDRWVEPSDNNRTIWKTSGNNLSAVLTKQSTQPAPSYPDGFVCMLYNLFGAGSLFLSVESGVTILDAKAGVYYTTGVQFSLALNKCARLTRVLADYWIWEAL